MGGDGGEVSVEGGFDEGGGAVLGGGEVAGFGGDRGADALDLEADPPWGIGVLGALPEAVGFIADEDEGGGVFHGGCLFMLHNAYLFQRIKV